MVKFVDKEIMVRFNPANRKHYEQKGYNYKYNKYEKIKIEDLHPNTNQKVKVYCDICGKIFEREYRAISKKDIIKCRSCAKRKNYKCDICGSESKPRRKYKDKMLCPKCYGVKTRKNPDYSIKDKNKIIIKDDHAEVVIKDKNGDIVGISLIDLEDVQLIEKYKWRLMLGYAKTTTKDIGMHQLIMNRYRNDMNKDLEIDHLNRNTLDNRKQNLKFVSHADNCNNRGGSEKFIYVGGLEKESIVDGIGIRNTIFCSFCLHKCEGCQNSELFELKKGKKMLIDDIFNEIVSDKEFINITFSGGDPFFQAKGFAKLAERIKKETNKTIWCYTGFTYEQIQSSTAKEFHELLKYIDVLVDGRFELDKRDLTLKWRGSSNQRVIDVQKSLKQEKIVLYCD